MTNIERIRVESECCHYKAAEESPTLLDIKPVRADCITVLINEQLPRLDLVAHENAEHVRGLGPVQHA